VRLSTAGVMKTLMRNGRDRRSENPLLGHAKKERVVLIGTDQRITSGPAAKRPHSKAEYMTAPERFADGQIPLAPRASSIHDPKLPSTARFCCDAQHTSQATCGRVGSVSLGRPFGPLPCRNDRIELGGARQAQAVRKADGRMRKHHQGLEGRIVQVIDGPFTGFRGEVKEVDEQTVKVDVQTFGRVTPVELALRQIELVPRNSN